MRSLREFKPGPRNCDITLSSKAKKTKKNVREVLKRIKNTS